MNIADYHTEKEVASVLKCSVAAVRKWRRVGLAAKRFGRLVRFQLPEVLAWFEAREKRV
jgi:excisionase family DNA binding protein